MNHNSRLVCRLSAAQPGASLPSMEAEASSPSRSISTHLRGALKACRGAWSHAARLASDCFDLAFLRVGAIRRFLNQPVSDLFEIRKRHEELFEDLAKAMDAFSQTEYGGPSTPPSSTVS